MTFMESVSTVLTKKYATFEGRASRSELWWFFLFNLLVQIALQVLAIALAGSGDQTMALIGGVPILIYVLAVLIPSLAVSVRRLHDTDRSGWWLLISFVPIVGFIVLLVFYCQRGTDGPNRFGPDPLGASGAMAHPAG